MTLQSMQQGLGKAWRDHPHLTRSAFMPVAVAYTTGEVLLGACYRRLLLGLADADIDLDHVPSLPERLAPTSDEERAAWRNLMFESSGIASPVRGGQRDVKQLMPLVPSLAAYASVLGKKRGRWEPADLVLAGLVAGAEGGDPAAVVEELRNALSVTGDDDVLARFVEDKVGALRESEPRTLEFRPALWRSAAERDIGQGRSPGEQFLIDIAELCRLDFKRLFTRRQWTALIEGVLRMGTAMYQFWNARALTWLWDATSAVSEGNDPPDVEEVVKQVWLGHRRADPLVALGATVKPSIEQMAARWMRARLGLSVALQALDDAGLGWDRKLGVTKDGSTPAEEIVAFLEHVFRSRDQVVRSVKSVDASAGSVRVLASRWAEARASQVNARSGPGKDLGEFLLHSLARLQVADSHQRGYDQSYVIHKVGMHPGAPFVARPGASTLMVATYLSSRAAVEEGTVHATMGDFREYLSNYGITAGPEQIGDGGQTTLTDMEQLGLVVDSADAGSGRLLVDPFGGIVGVST